MLVQAGDNLVVLEVESTDICQTGFDEPEYQWKEDKEASLVPCKKLKHVLQRTARDSPDVKFVTLEVWYVHQQMTLFCSVQYPVIDHSMHPTTVVRKSTMTLFDPVLCMLQASTTEGQEACEKMNIEILPTIQFWKNKQLLWEHRGVSQLDQDLSEGNFFPQAALCNEHALLMWVFICFKVSQCSLVD